VPKDRKLTREEIEEQVSTSPHIMRTERAMQRLREATTAIQEFHAGPLQGPLTAQLMMEADRLHEAVKRAQIELDAAVEAMDRESRRDLH
jgi:hypothetical protein